MSSLSDTIVAISTPPGRGGIGVVRVSGANAQLIAASLLANPGALAPAEARFTRILDAGAAGADGRAPVLDEAVVTFFPAPHSYTGEDVVEMSTHGAPVILEHVVRSCLRNGARLARPGEFTERAFLSGRLDLTQAEAVHDLVQATTLHQARTAASQLGGSLARAITPAKQQLVQLIATLEAGIDFAEDDIDLLPESAIAEQIAAIVGCLAALERTFAFGRILREGFSLAIVGRPNSGKSSLFNALLARERAIVTSSPGTTRDLITEHLAIHGIPVQLSDTAGLRESTDEAESLGIAKSREALAEASLILLVIDSTLPVNAEDLALLTAHAGRPMLVARNKIDLLPSGLRVGTALPDGVRVIDVSARTSAGLPDLQDAIRDALATEPEGGTGAAMLTNIRQHEAVAAGLAALAAATTAVQDHTPHEVLLLDLHAALRALDELTGVTTADNILQLIFSSFCIGK